MTTHRALLVILLLASAGAAAEGLPELSARLDAIAKQADGLRAGDRATANALVGEVNGVRTELGRMRERDAAWKAQVDRSSALIDRIRAQGLKAPTGEPAPPGAQVAMSSIDRHYFEEYEKVAARYHADLERIDAIASLDSRSLEGAAAQMRAALDRVGDQQHPSVVAARAAIEQFEARRAGKMTEGKQAAEKKAAAFAAEAKDVGGQLDQLAALFGPSFDCKLQRPYTPARVTEWLGELKQYQRMKEKGSTHLQRLVAEHPAFEHDERLTRLEVFFTKRLGGILEGCLAHAATEDPAKNQGRYGAFQQLISSGNWALNNHAPHAVLKDMVAALRDGAEGAEALATYREVWLGKKDPESRALAQRMRQYIDTLEAKAKAALEATRMPDAASTDSGLLATATSALKAAGYSSWERMVVSSAMHHTSTTATDTREQGDYLIISTYPRVYDQFQVCLAEKSGAAYRLVYYSIRKYSRGAPGTPLDRWLVADRIVMGQILKENIDR